MFPSLLLPHSLIPPAPHPPLTPPPPHPPLTILLLLQLLIFPSLLLLPILPSFLLLSSSSHSSWTILSFSPACTCWEFPSFLPLPSCTSGYCSHFPIHHSKHTVHRTYISHTSPLLLHLLSYVLHLITQASSPKQYHWSHDLASPVHPQGLTTPTPKRISLSLLPPCPPC